LSVDYRIGYLCVYYLLIIVFLGHMIVPQRICQWCGRTTFTSAVWIKGFIFNFNRWVSNFRYSVNELQFL